MFNILEQRWSIQSSQPTVLCLSVLINFAHPKCAKEGTIIKAQVSLVFVPKSRPSSSESLSFGGNYCNDNQPE